MSTRKQEIVKPANPEVQIIPADEVPGIIEIIATLNTEALELNDLYVRAQQWSINNKQEFSDAGADLKKIRDIKKRPEELIRPSLRRLADVADMLRAEIKRQELKAEPAETLLAGKLADYNRREELAAKQEQDRINAENKRRQEELAAQQRKADENAAREKKAQRIQEIHELLKAKKITKGQAEKELRAAGATEEADKVQAQLREQQTAAAVPETRVVPNTGTAAGLRSHTTLMWEVTDIEQVPRHLLYPNLDKNGKYRCEDLPNLGKTIREAKTLERAQAAAGKGVKIWEDHRV